MKRIRTLGSLVLALAALSGCERNIPIDNPDENPAINRPLGILRGTATYVGAGPCIRNGQIEGALVLLLFDAANPPPPDGLASTAVNFATVPGERLFYNVPRPQTGPGSPGNPNSLCPSVDSPSITATVEWSMQQVGAGRYQVRAFYSRQNRFIPLFNFANLPLAGDVFGGAFVDPRAPLPRFAAVEVGVPIVETRNCATLEAEDKERCERRKLDAAAGKLEIPPLGFIREGVAVTLVNTLRSNRPFFHVNYAGSTSYGLPAKIEADFTTNWAGQRKLIQGTEAAQLGMISFPQDHLSTSQTNAVQDGKICLGNKDPDCDLFKIAQLSFPQIRFRYGFPGDPANILDGKPNDAWLMKNAVPRDPFFRERMRPYYGIDPKEFAAADPALKSSGAFMLSRVFNARNEPEILRDNQTLEEVAQIAEIFPSVVLAKMVEDGEGNLAMPPRSQTDPIVVIQTITVRDWPGKGVGSMKATSQSATAGGALTDADGKAPDPNHPLAQRGGFELQDGFTALVRPSVVCIHPQVELRGTLVTPVRTDPNPDNKGAPLVAVDKILTTRANRVKDVKFGCLPPGHYSINIVYPTGQAWSFPNLSGHCSYSARFEPNEECMTPPWNVNPFRAGFPLRPLVQSQMLFQTDAEGKIKTGPDPFGVMRPLPQVVRVLPSPRCGSMKNEAETTCNNDDECKALAPWAYRGICMAGPSGKRSCDLNADGKINATPVWVNNPVNEDTSLDAGGTVSPLSANGVLDSGEDLNKNGRLDLKVPNVCSLPLSKWATILDPTQQLK